jgi:hypothetical protein
MVGIEQILGRRNHGAYTGSVIAGFGGTTPLSSSSLGQAFVAPAFGTVECNTLYAKFSNYFALAPYNIIKGSANQATGATTGTTASACLLNTNSPTTTGTPAVTTYAPVNNIGFSSQDRHGILGKYEFGIRTIDRFMQPGARACGDLDPASKIAPCQRGVVDFTVGADASITGGVFRKWIFKVEAVHPLPIKGTAYLYLFGSFSMRFQRDQIDAPLILQAASTATLTGTGSTAVPNVNTVVLPLTQPNRDFYRFGVGLDVACVFTKIFASKSTCAVSSPAPSTSGG